MTTCIYYKNKLVSDGLVTCNGSVVTKFAKKTGMIYECLITKKRSLVLENLQHPVEFAMYAFSGSLAEKAIFLAWLLSTPIHGIDYEYFESLPEYFDNEDINLQAMIIFKNFDIVRTYSSDYILNRYFDYSKCIFNAVGSGTEAARAIHYHNTQEEPENILQTVSEIDIYTGGKFHIDSFSIENFIPLKDNKQSLLNKIKTKLNKMVF